MRKTKFLALVAMDGVSRRVVDKDSNYNKRRTKTMCEGNLSWSLFLFLVGGGGKKESLGKSAAKKIPQVSTKS